MVFYGSTSLHEFLQNWKLASDLDYKSEGGISPKPENRHKHEHNNKHVTKQQGNNDPSSTLFMNKFTPKPCFLKF